MSIQSELNKSYVGEIWEGLELDLRPIGVTGPDELLYLTNLSDQPVNWQGNTYLPFPYQIEGVSRQADQAPNRITISFSNVNRSLAGLIINYGDLVGARIKIWKTLKVFMDGQAQANVNQHFQPQSYIIIQKNQFNESLAQFTASSILDRPTDFLPKRQILIDDVPGALYCPGVSRRGLRSR